MFEIANENIFEDLEMLGDFGCVRFGLDSIYKSTLKPNAS